MTYCGAPLGVLEEARPVKVSTPSTKPRASRREVQTQQGISHLESRNINGNFLDRTAELINRQKMIQIVVIIDL